MARFTVKDLREGVAELNGHLEDAGATVRFKIGGEAGCQTAAEVCAIDRKSNFMEVGRGTSREVYHKVYARYNAIIRELDGERAKAKLADTEARLADAEARLAKQN